MPVLPHERDSPCSRASRWRWPAARAAVWPTQTRCPPNGCSSSTRPGVSCRPSCLRQGIRRALHRHADPASRVLRRVHRCRLASADPTTTRRSPRTSPEVRAAVPPDVWSPAASRRSPFVVRLPAPAAARHSGRPCRGEHRRPGTHRTVASAASWGCRRVTSSGARSSRRCACIPRSPGVVVVVGQRSQRDRIWRDRVLAERHVFSGRVAIEMLDGLPTDDLLRRLAALGPDVDRLHRRDSTIDADGPQLDARMPSAMEIVGAARVPVYGGVQHVPGHRLVGGYMADFQTQGRGRRAAASALLDGIRPEALTLPPSVPTRDARGLASTDAGSASTNGRCRPTRSCTSANPRCGRRIGTTSWCTRGHRAGPGGPDRGPAARASPPSAGRDSVTTRAPSSRTRRASRWRASWRPPWPTRSTSRSARSSATPTPPR